MHLRLFCFSLMCLISISISAQKAKTVVGTYEYHAPKNISIEEADRIALERAKIQAIADEFGTVVSQSNFTSVNNRNGQSDIDFFSLGGSEVKGEWIETIGKPEFIRSFSDDGTIIVHATVKGRIREIIHARANFQAKVLCNGTDLKFERNDFHPGDDLYLYFKSPVDGYLNVYLLDETSQMVYCLLPYRSSGAGAVKVEHDEPYVFFSKEEAKGNAAEVDEYVMTCSRAVERNVVYVMFSPNEFTKATLEDAKEELRPRQTDWKDYQKWAVKCRNRDKELVIEQLILTIKQ